MGAATSHSPQPTAHPPFTNSPPLDVLRHIVEIAAFDDPESACSLARVSRDFQAWVEPVLYRTVVLSFKSHVTNFETMIRTRGILQKYVKDLVVRFPACLPVPLLAECCTSLESLYIDVGDLNRLRDLGSLSSLPPHSNLTHLVCVGDIPRNVDQDPASFPMLTHFACHYRVQGGVASILPEMTAAQLINVLEPVLRTLLRCNTLQVFILLVQDDGCPTVPSEVQIRSRMLHDLTEYLSDDRVILIGVPPRTVPTFNLLENWDYRTGRMWHTARKIVESRKHMYSAL
ncbi:hypothetical protein BDN71DRAFT_1441274 [Pleurotus eryngii]|uniref:F-box domain-containing protein n=1 Tax=Pleurotus eryngii TaxID=5323 RepID=A0A9P6A7N7_PLEER|nr:hypothetical protein BDN71DRAFT_1441274 [Pleurotus eryngii]